MNAQFGIPGDGKRTGPDDDRPPWILIMFGIALLVVVLAIVLL
jgi:hypothetical protein